MASAQAVVLSFSIFTGVVNVNSVETLFLLLLCGFGASPFCCINSIGFVFVFVFEKLDKSFCCFNWLGILAVWHANLTKSFCCVNWLGKSAVCAKASA